MLQIVGMGITVIGVVGIIYSTIMEIKLKEPFYALLMKIFPVVFAIGIVIMFSL